MRTKPGGCASSQPRAETNFSRGLENRVHIKPKINLYVLDSTRIDLLPPHIANEVKKKMHHIAAYGYVDLWQRTELSRMIDEEKEPVIRLLATHYPLAYPNTDSYHPEVIPEVDTYAAEQFKNKLGKLVNVTPQVLVNLEYVQRDIVGKFAGVLCGHQHKGFTKIIFPDNPVLVLSAGAATYDPPTTEKHLIGRITNEYRIYDFQIGDSKDIHLTVRVFRDIERRMKYAFTEQEQETFQLNSSR